MPGCVQDYDQLRNVAPPSDNLDPCNYIFVAGLPDPANSGLRGFFSWCPNSAGQDNGGTVIKPNALSEGSTGRWQRVFDGAVSVKWFGARGDSAHDDTVAVQAALSAVHTAGGGTVYLPSGTYKLTIQPLGNGHVRSLAAWGNTRVTGPGVLKLANSQPNYFAIIEAETPATDMSGFHLDGVTIDCNGSNNLISAASDITTGLSRIAFWCANGSDIRVTGCNILDVGDVINVIIINGDIGVNGIGTCSVSNVKITGNRILDVGRQPAAAFATYGHDHASIYVSATGYEVADNDIRGYRPSGQPGSGGAATAIEIHGPDAHVHHNKVRDYTNGMNLTGVVSFGSSQNIEVNQNDFGGVRVGVELWSLYYPPFIAGFALDDVRIHHNRIQIERDAWPYAYPATTSSPIAGICYWNTAISGYPFAPTRGVRIEDNFIDILPSSLALQGNDYLDAGIQWFQNDQSFYHEDVTIARNTVRGALAQGFYVATRISHFDYLSNCAIDPGASVGTFADDYRKGHILSGAGGAMVSWRVNWNNTVDTRATHQVFAGIELDKQASIIDCEALDNNAYAADGFALVPFYVKNLATAVAVAGAYFVRGRMAVAYAVASVGAARYGSTIIDEVNGVTYRQSTAPSGTNWQPV